MPAGAPTKYKKQYNEQVYKLALLGATDKEFADFFNVEEKTINNWKKREPEFLQSIKTGKIEADTKVAESLYKRALGYKYDEVYFEKVDNKVNLEITPNEMITTDTYKKKIVTKELPPDVAAVNIWLKNRRGKVNPNDGIRWAERQDIDIKDDRRTLDNEQREARIEELKIKLGVKE
jgi:hypothetical protein